MKRLGTKGSKAAIKRRGKTASRARRNAPESRAKSKGEVKSKLKGKAKATRVPSTASLQDKLDRLTQELNEALEQQKATAEVLRIISSSPGELDGVFKAILENATRICEAKFGTAFRFDGKEFHSPVHVGAPPQYDKFVRSRGPFLPVRGSTLERVMLSMQVCYSADIGAEAAFNRAVKLGGGRSFVGVPMLRDGALVGVLAIWRREVRPFTDKQIELLTNFAAQAVIAIENARLLNELRHRTADLSESLEQQTATSEVLKVISSSPGELEPVFQAMLESATRICEAKFGILYRFDGEAFHFAADVGTPRKFADYLRRRGPHQPPPGTNIAVLWRTKDVVRITDDLASPTPGAAARVAGARSIVSVPMLKENVLIGAITIFRQEVRPFTDKQVEFVRNFAAQAVIAIENTRLLKELRESLERQTATSEVLRVISSSPGELEPVFQAMLENAVRICGAKFGNLFLLDAEGLQIGATYGAPQAYVDFLHSENALKDLNPEVGVSRLLRTKERYQVSDLAAAPKQGDKLREATIELAGARTLIGVPMLKDGEAIGAIIIYRQEVRPFTEKQIELLTNFAAQAVIAIENARLLNELRQRTDDLTESLEQQTATSEVLGVISASPGELAPVFDAMLANAVRICEAKFGTLYRYDGNAFHFAAQVGAPPEFAEFQGRRGPFQPRPGTQLDRVMRTNKASHTADLAAETVPDVSARLAGARSIVIVPMLKDDTLVGAITIYRQEVRPFTDKQIALVQNFAAQAVIAIENTRLLNELRQRTDDLTESLEQQTATSEVLRVISSSPSELTPVFQTMLANATHLCEANFGTLNLYDNGAFPVAATHNVPNAYAEFRRRAPILNPDPRHPLARVAAAKQVVQIADMRAEPLYTEKDPSFVAMVDLAGARTLFVVPLLKENECVGAITIFRQEVRPFTDKQIELVKNFAAQAVIAIENTRLLNELRESLEQQTATADVLKVISSSPGELTPVFDAMLDNAVRICEASFGVLSLYEDGMFRVTAMHNVPPAFAALRQREPSFHASPISAAGRVAATKQPLHIADYTQEETYKNRDPAAVSLGELGGARTVVVVPMLKDNALVGTIFVYRQEVRPFTDKQIALLENFAAQAVIAIENTRLLNELRESLEQQTATADVLRVISSSPGDLQPVFESVLANATRLCGANFGNLQLHEDGAFRMGARHNMPPALAEARQQQPVVRYGPRSPVTRLTATRQIVHIPDFTEEPAYKERDPGAVRMVELAGARTHLLVPMLKENELIGFLGIYRREIKPFAAKQIELVQNFAAQAVIAIENARLLNELRARTADLTESLEQQTATSEVLGVIELLSRRPWTGVCNHAGKRRPHLRRQIRQYLPLGGRRFAFCGVA